MSSETDPFMNNKIKRSTTTATSSSFRWNLRRGRRPLPSVRLGGKKPRRKFSLVRLCRRAKLKWLRLKYSCMLKKLKKYYESFVKDMMEGSRTIEAFQQRMLLETSFAVPAMGLSFNAYPSTYSIHDRMF